MYSLFGFVIYSCGFVIYSCKANGLELWLTHCWPSVYAAITSTNRFFFVCHIMWLCISNYMALFF